MVGVVWKYEGNIHFFLMSNLFETVKSQVCVGQKTSFKGFSAVFGLKTTGGLMHTTTNTPHLQLTDGT